MMTGAVLFISSEENASDMIVCLQIGNLIPDLQTYDKQGTTE